MGLLNKVFRSDPNIVSIGGFKNAASILLGSGGRTESNEIVTHHTALHTAIVYACVSIISEKIATTPFLLYEVARGKGKELAFDHDYYGLIHTKPNDEQDAVNFRTAVMVSCLLEGNGYIELQRDNANRVVNMWHRSSYGTRPVRMKDGKLAYETIDGANGGPARVLEAANMIHIMAMTLDGYKGLNPIEYQRRTIGKHIAMDKYSSRFYANFATPQLALTQALEIAPEDKTKMREEWELLQSGANQHRVAILDGGFKLEPISINQKDAQFLESMLATRRDIAAIYKVPGHMVGDTEKGIKANVEQQAQDFLTTCLGPWFTKWETAYNTKLFSTLGRSAGKYAAKFNIRGLLRPDAASRTTFYQSGIQNGYLSDNDVREMEDLNPIGADGDKYFLQLNMQRLDQVGQALDQAATQTDPATTGTTSKPAAPAPAPKEKDTELEDEQEENALPLAKLKAQYRGLYRGSVNRLLNSSARDSNSVHACMWPVLEVMSTAFRMNSEQLTSDSECYKAIEKLCDGIAHRVGKWSADDIDTLTDTELKRAVRSLVFAANRDAANAQALKTLETLEAEELITEE